MDEQGYKAIRDAWVRERDEALSTVTRLNRNISDLDKTWKKVVSSSRKAAPVAGSQTGRAGSLVSRVSAVVCDLPEEFGSPDVWAAVEQANPGEYDFDSVGFKANVANVLKGLVRDGRIAVVTPGVGNRPARFRRTDSDERGGLAM